MSTARTKRQFAGAASDPAQRQITSFFNKSNGPNGPYGDASNSSSIGVTTISPALPAQVQSNLLSVGMRVRKSVPEGYKTGSAYSSFALWADADAANSKPSGPDGQTSWPSASTTSLPRELTPFCGIHKVGGLSVQPDSSPRYSLPAAAFQVTLNPVPSVDDVPGLSSSQESTTSTASTDSVASRRLMPPPIHTAMGAVRATATNRKRFYSDDDSSEVPGVHSEFRVRDASWWDGEVSPRSLAPASWDNARAMAFPRRRGLKSGAVRAIDPPTQKLSQLGQENVDMVIDGDDFEEAAFLDSRWGEMDVE